MDANEFRSLLEPLVGRKWRILAVHPLGDAMPFEYPKEDHIGIWMHCVSIRWVTTLTTKQIHCYYRLNMKDTDLFLEVSSDTWPEYEEHKESIAAGLLPGFHIDPHLARAAQWLGTVLNIEVYGKGTIQLEVEAESA